MRIYEGWKQPRANERLKIAPGAFLDRFVSQQIDHVEVRSIMESMLLTAATPVDSAFSDLALAAWTQVVALILNWGRSGPKLRTVVTSLLSLPESAQLVSRHTSLAQGAPESPKITERRKKLANSIRQRPGSDRLRRRFQEITELLTAGKHSRPSPAPPHCDEAKEAISELSARLVIGWMCVRGKAAITRGWSRSPDWFTSLIRATFATDVNDGITREDSYIWPLADFVTGCLEELHFRFPGRLPALADASSTADVNNACVKPTTEKSLVLRLPKKFSHHAKSVRVKVGHEEPLRTITGLHARFLDRLWRNNMAEADPRIIERGYQSSSALFERVPELKPFVRVARVKKAINKKAKSRNRTTTYQLVRGVYIDKL